MSDAGATEAPKRRRLNTLAKSELPAHSIGAAAGLGNGGSAPPMQQQPPPPLPTDIDHLTVETTRRLLGAEKRERTQLAFERLVESLQELLLLFQWARSNKANSRLAMAKIAESRRGDAEKKQ